MSKTTLPSNSPSPEFPFSLEEAQIARQSFLRAHMTPKVAILAGKLLNLFLVCVIGYGAFHYLRLHRKLGEMKVMYVRINDIGRAEAVRLDQDYTPQEPEIREQIERFVTRYYTKQGFSIPEALEALPLFMDQGLYQIWRKQALEDLNAIAAGQGLRRVRILSCRIENPAAAKTSGTQAIVRFATDAMTNTGAFAGGVPEGFESVIRFRVGIFPEVKDQDGQKGSARDQWIVRNPLGMKVSEIQQTRYIGSDVEDPNVNRIIDVTQARAEETSKGIIHNQRVEELNRQANTHQP